MVINLHSPLYKVIFRYILSNRKLCGLAQEPNYQL